MARAESEGGYLSALLLCVVLAACLLGLSLWQVVGCHVAGSGEYLQETRLRLAAEGQLELCARELEGEPQRLKELPPGKWQLYEEKEADGCHLLVSVKRDGSQAAGGREGPIYLQAWAEPLETAKDGWQRGKLVQGWLYERGGKCVWQGYRAGAK